MMEARINNKRVATCRALGNAIDKAVLREGATNGEMVATFLVTISAMLEGAYSCPHCRMEAAGEILTDLKAIIGALPEKGEYCANSGLGTRN